MDTLKFVVLDEEDLEIASTHLQDAVVKVADVHWRPGEKRLIVALNRFDGNVRATQMQIATKIQTMSIGAAGRLYVLSALCHASVNT
jgi:hypothetical protein